MGVSLQVGIPVLCTQHMLSQILKTSIRGTDYSHNYKLGNRLREVI